MPTESPIRTDSASWRGVFSLSRRGLDDRRALETELGRFCEARGVEEAALYSEDNGEGFCLKLRFGTSELPDDPPAEPPEGWHKLDLPETILYFTPGSATVTAEDSDLLLIAAGARISCLKRQIHEQSFQAKFRGVELEALYDVGLQISSTLDLETLCEEVLMRAISLLDARRGALYLLEDGQYRLHRTVGGLAREEFDPSEVDLDRLVRGDWPSGWIPGVSHLLTVPVEIEGEPRGLLVVADKESRHGVGPFPSTDRRSLRLFANQAAIALENAKLHKLALEKERLEREMELASEIQRQILPDRMPEIPGFEVAGWNRPARQVGGDYFDLHGLANDHLGLVVGDVTGKGMPAALLVSTLHSALRVLLDRMEVGTELIERLNRHICESSSINKFITMLLASVDCKTRRMVYLNAGHNPGLLLRPDGARVQLDSGGLPLGLMPDGTYEAAELQLGNGDLLCLYSDGITECEAPDEEEFGLERLIDLLEERRDDPLEGIIQCIDRSTTEFAQGQPQGDDQTVVLLRCCP